MYIVGLTGIIGAGKSTVARLLADRGAVVIDADKLGHEAYEPGTDCFRRVVEEFGDGIVRDGRIHRPALADVVFSDPAKLARLSAIVQPWIGVQMLQRLVELQDTQAIVVLDVALFVDKQIADTMVVVVASPESQVQHLQSRGMPADDARRRMANQPSAEVKLKLADHEVYNDGTLVELEARVDEVWSAISAAAKQKEVTAEASRG